jgi:hypothetical protein
MLRKAKVRTLERLLLERFGGLAVIAAPAQSSKRS